MGLMKQKDELESSILGITEYLTAPWMPGLSGNLIDAEGFPRADLDLFEIRKMRNRLACLQTDHTTLMKQIEQGLYRLHTDHYMNMEEAKQGEPIQQKMEMISTSSDAGKKTEQQLIPEVKIPFAWISDVIADSPADNAGLKVGDAIYKFGDVNHANHDSLKGIVNLVKAQLNQQIIIWVLRKTLMGGTEDKEIGFVPREWGGRGFLGCALKVNPI